MPGSLFAPPPLPAPVTVPFATQYANYQAQSAKVNLKGRIIDFLAKYNTFWGTQIKIPINMTFPAGISPGFPLDQQDPSFKDKTQTPFTRMAALGTGAQDAFAKLGALRAYILLAAPSADSGDGITAAALDIVLPNGAPTGYVIAPNADGSMGLTQV